MKITKSEIIIHNSPFTLGFSPCPNDTFIFDAMIHGKIDTEGLSFDYVLADVEELNHKASQEQLDVTKLSYFAYAFVAHRYQLLNSGSALGFGCGPLLISKQDVDINEIEHFTVAVPGLHTTANFLFSMAFPKAKNKKVLLFSEIENAILTGAVDAGIIIHETRFTYQQKGLIKLLDLGEYWEKLTHLAIPLGGIAVKRSLPDNIKIMIDNSIRRSVEFALVNPMSGIDFIRANAQEMEQEVMYKHIALYVNDFSVSLGEKGMQAVNRMYEIATEKNIIPGIPRDIFIQ